MSSLIDWNIDQERDAAATGVDPYEPITEEDEGFPGWVGAAVVLLMGLATVAHVFAEKASILAVASTAKPHGATESGAPAKYPEPGNAGAQAPWAQGGNFAGKGKE